MCDSCERKGYRLQRRQFLSMAGAAGLGLALRPSSLFASPAQAPQTMAKRKAVVMAAFLYPPSSSLKEAGYYSWPGSGFDAEGHQVQYSDKIRAMAQELGIDLRLESQALQVGDSAAAFIAKAKQEQPDGLLLIPFKKSEWTAVKQIVTETHLPTVAMTTLGVLLMPYIVEMQSRPGVYTIASLDNFEAIGYGLRMIRTTCRMKQSLILSVAGTETREYAEDRLGTRVRVVPMQRLVEVFQAVPLDDEVKEIAHRYLSKAKRRVEPTRDDVLEAARATVACKRLIQEEGADALMMQCLEGIQARQIPPPCMGYMDLRDEGIPAGCQNEISSTLTLMLVQELFNKPGFQQNAGCDTERNLYFGAHCTCPSKLHGPEGRSAPYILRNHAEAGVGCVPQVLWPVGEPVTLALYEPGLKPRMIAYSGEVAACYDQPPAGGCRTNLAMTVHGVEDAFEVKGMHQIIFAGDHLDQIKSFSQLMNIPVVA